jgi:uncharacterized damage-inducible protein DinB
MPSAWFERAFTFTTPIELYPNIVERLRGTPARLEERVRQLPRDILTRRDGERWSIQEQVGHLLDLDALHTERLGDYEAALEVLTPADLQNRKTHEARHNEHYIADILRAFRAGRAELVRRMDAYDLDFAARTALHPRLQQPMRLIDMALFTAEHDDHHLARITELLRLFL